MSQGGHRYQLCVDAQLVVAEKEAELTQSESKVSKLNRVTFIFHV